MNDILLRASTGLIFIGLVIGGIVFSQISNILVLSLFAVLGLLEYYRLFDANKMAAPSKMIGLTGGFSIFLIAILVKVGYIDFKFLIVSLPLLFLSFLPELYSKSKTPLVNISITIFGWIYILLPLYLIIGLRVENTSFSSWIIPVGMFLLIWTNDTFAYLTGRFLGKTKLFERISPKKTWEGTVGGIVFTCVVAYLIAYFSEMSYLFWCLAAPIVAASAIYGDLFESLIKRSLNIKDTGTILPGHGGILDRFDAALFTAPLFFTWCVLWEMI
ncbi:MAG: phosphatidate cytidylyltransferase [Lishizhenia sp.]